MLGFPLLYLKGMRLLMFQLSSFCCNVGALIIRRGFWGISYPNCVKEPPKIVLVIISAPIPIVHSHTPTPRALESRQVLPEVSDPCVYDFDSSDNCTGSSMEDRSLLILGLYNIEAYIVTYTILVLPYYYDYSMTYPKTLFLLLMPLRYRALWG